MKNWEEEKKNSLYSVMKRQVPKHKNIIFSKASLYYFLLACDRMPLLDLDLTSSSSDMTNRSLS